MRWKTHLILRKVLRHRKAPAAYFANSMARRRTPIVQLDAISPSSQIWMMEHEFRDGSECHGEASCFRRGK